MAKRESSPELTEEFKKTLAMTNLIDVEVDDELKKSFIAYAMAVNVSRAIPDVRDGLKPVHRRILYSMHEMGLYNDKAYRKCARIVGDVLGKYHPHGDSAVYDALVRLAQDFTINFPLVDGHGNFGSVDGDPPAAMRYTEARMSKLAAEMLRDLDKETVDYYPTFDDTGMQPTVLPARFPNLLVNGSGGIAPFGILNLLGTRSTHLAVPDYWADMAATPDQMLLVCEDDLDKPVTKTGVYYEDGETTTEYRFEGPEGSLSFISRETPVEAVHYRQTGTITDHDPEAYEMRDGKKYYYGLTIDWGEREITSREEVRVDRQEVTVGY